MRLRSFRLRIMLLSALLSGCVLFAFGAWAWSFSYRMGLQRLDHDIRKLCTRHLAFHQPGEYWESVSASLGIVYGTEDAIVLMVKDRQGRILHQSDNWPSEWAADSFPTPQTFSEVPPDFVPLDGPQRGGGFGRGDRRGPPGGRQDQRPPLDAIDGDLIGNPVGPQPLQQPGPRPDARNMDIPGGMAGLPPLPGRGAGPPPRLMPVSIPVLLTRGASGQVWRIGVMGNPDVTMVLGLNQSRFNFEVIRARNAYLIAIPLALALIAAGGWLLAQRALRPVRALTATAERITAKGLDQRIPASREDAEFMRLIGVFNEMLDRLERSFKQAVRFSADAAHELKTPLTILQGELEQALQAAEAGSSAQQLSSSLLEEVQRLKSIIRKLLLLSLADAGQLKLNLEPLNFSEMVESACDDVQILAPELTVQSDVEDGVWIEADRDLLVQLVQNLSNNAIKYNRPGGKIGIQLKRNGQTAQFTIMNTGTSIPREDREKVFDRFYRGDPSRNRKVDGVGLGLSLAREIARAHRGELALQETPDGVVAFRLTLATYDGVLPTASPAQTPRSLPDSTPGQ